MGKAMFRLMLQRLLHKKWMAVCLLLGNILLIAVTAGYPMYKNASIDRMMEEEFHNYNLEHYQDVGLITFSMKYLKSDSSSQFTSFQKKVDGMVESLGASQDMAVNVYTLDSSSANMVMKRDDTKDTMKVRLASMTDLEEHITILKGEIFSESQTGDVIEAIVSKNTFIHLGLILQDELTFPNIKDVNGKPITVRIVGVFERSEVEDKYWAEDPSTYVKEVFIPSSIFATNFLESTLGNYNLNGEWYRYVDYTSIEVDQMNSLIKETKNMVRKGSSLKRILEPGYLSVIEGLSEKLDKIKVTLLVLQIPVLVLLSIFLVMISKQMLSMEQNEISILKSRGASKRQIVGMYLMQCTLLSVIASILGILLGMGMCRVIGASNEFMEFVKKEPLEIHLNGEVFLYTLGAVLFSILLTVLPVLRYSRVNIVELKRMRQRKASSLWKTLYLDIILILISMYGYFNFTKNQSSIVKDVMSGKTLDPLLYLCSSLFLLGAALLFVRIQPMILSLLYKLGRKKYQPSLYVSFLQSIRTGTKQQFIIIFLVLTVSLGIYNSTAARTILANSDKNETYLAGTDLIVSEVWSDNSMEREKDPSIPFEYIEPDASKYLALTEAESVTKVLYDEKASFAIDKKKKQSAILMGIHTKEFGETIYFEDGLLPYHINDYLNMLSMDTSYVLVSANFKTKYGYQLQDSITYYDQLGNMNKGRICGFVDYFPTYHSMTYQADETGEVESKDCFLIIGHLSEIQKKCAVTPYQFWIKAKIHDTSFFYPWAEQVNLQVSKITDLSETFQKTRNDSLFQGTNGVLTMCFIIILILCGVGYLMYWILSIRERELLFGVFRAMGMSRKEIIAMLVQEQIMTGLSSVLYGTLAGQIGCILFVPMIQTAYAAANQILPLTFVQEQVDLLKLYMTIAIVLFICIFVLIKIISKMKISNALKLGED